MSQSPRESSIHTNPGAPSSARGHRLILVGSLALALYALGVLSIGLTRDWRLRNEDNGALQTTLALSHRELGLARTRAHDVFFNPHAGVAVPYGHHPPATALVLAGAFALTGSDSPAVARLTAIAFHLASIFLLTMLLGQFFGARRALLGGAVMATVPMSAYFGRMVNYEPLCLFAVLVQLYGYVRFRRTRGSRYLVCLAAGILAGGLVDWPSFFFTAALACVEAVDLMRRRATSPRLFAVLAACAAATFAFDLWHLWYAGGGSIQALAGVASQNRPIWKQDFTIRRFVFGETDTFRRYFTEVGLLSVLFVLTSLVRARAPLSRRLFDVTEPQLLKRVLLAAGAAALAYLVAFPAWAMAHQYWQFYFLPFVVTSMVLAWGLLQRAIDAHPTALLRTVRVLCILEVLAASAYWVHFRHTRPEPYAIETTARFRSTFLAPHSFSNETGTPGQKGTGQR